MVDVTAVAGHLDALWYHLKGLKHELLEDQDDAVAKEIKLRTDPFIEELMGRIAAKGGMLKKFAEKFYTDDVQEAAFEGIKLLLEKMK